MIKTDAYHQMEQEIQTELEKVFQQAEDCHRLLGFLIQERSNLVYWKTKELLDCGQKIKSLEMSLSSIKQFKKAIESDDTKEAFS